MKKLYLLVLFIIIISSSFIMAQWVQKKNGIYVECLAVSGNNIFAGSWSDGVFLSTDNGSNWTQVNTGLTGLSIRALAVSGSNIFAGTYGDGVFLSTNNGSNWTAVNTGLTYKIVLSLAVSGSKIFAGTNGGGVFFSTDNGSSWTQVFGTLNSGVKAFAVSGSNIFASFYGLNVSLSTDNGSSWFPLMKAGYPMWANALALNGSNLFAGTNGGGVNLLTLNDSNWTQVNTGLIGPMGFFVNSFAVSGINIFAGTGAGVYLSTNNGSNWTEVNTGLPLVVSVGPLAISGGNIFAGTMDGVWSRPLSDIITASEDNNNTLPKNYFLSQNYPNPFNPSTVIRFDLPKASRVSIDIYNLLGQRVSEILNAEETAGLHEVIFNAHNFASGIYFYRLSAKSVDGKEQFLNTKKMILLK